MWLHAAIGIMLLAVFIALKTGQLKKQEGLQEKSIRMFLLVAAAGNALGLFMTVREEMDPQKEYSMLVREESGMHEEELAIISEGEKPATVRIQVPGKEKPVSSETDSSQDDFLISEKAKREREIGDEVALYNREKSDPDYYYLPGEISGKACTWTRPRDKSGILLAGLFLAGGLAVMILSGREAQKKELMRHEQMLLDYPPIIMKFTLLIQAGMSVRRSFQKIASDYQAEAGKPDTKRRKKLPVRHAYEEIVVVCNELDSGVSEAEAYRHFGERCGQIKYRTFSTLLVQNLQKGSRSLADILERESEAAWEERKRKARISGETASTKLLFPMILMLLVVMAVIMVPAFAAFWG